ncbi:conserved domain protein [delta proteobacterium NaphS2]|nr:conserved domain protein [delta proteobacterium NaphS2]
MKLSHLFTGKPYDEIEKDADALFQMGEYGSAKLEYERALHKSAKKAPEAQDQLETKIAECKNALALEHLKSAENLIEAGLHEEAQDLLRLALELARDKQLAIEIEEQLKQLETHPIVHEISRISDNKKDLNPVAAIRHPPLLGQNSRICSN